MSADNGWLLRKNEAGKYVMQMYFASADSYPPIEANDVHVFETMAAAISWYEHTAPYSEYGLTVKILYPTPNKISTSLIDPKE